MSNDGRTWAGWLRVAPMALLRQSFTGLSKSRLLCLSPILQSVGDTISGCFW